MFHPWQDLPLCGGVAAQLVRDDHARHLPQTAQQLAKETLGGLCIAPALDEDVEHVAVLVDRAPEIMRLALDADEHLVHEPFVARLWPPPLSAFANSWPKSRLQSRMASSLTTTPRAAMINSTSRRLKLKLKQ